MVEVLLDDEDDDTAGFLASTAKSSAVRGVLQVDAGEQDGTMLVIGPSDSVRVEISDQADVVPVECPSLDLSLAAVPVQPGTELRVRAFAADDRQLFELLARVVANRSNLIGTIGTPPTT